MDRRDRRAGVTGGMAGPGRPQAGSRWGSAQAQTGDAADGELAARHAHLRADALDVLTSWVPPDPGQGRVRDNFVAHLRARPASTAKDGPAAHLTASCLVLSAHGDAVLLTLHRRARMWFQFGGHLEPEDAGVYDAAARECREESGVEGVSPWRRPVHLNRHVLSGEFGRCREHLDIRFAAVAPTGAVPVTSAESLDVRWWPVDELPSGSPTELADLVAAARAVALRTGAIG